MSLIAYTQNGSGAGTSPDTNDQNVHETRGLFLLSLDGGGVKGLSTLYILRGIMNRLNDKREGQGLGKVKPCELFDLIAGTSTGGYVRLVPAITYRTYSLTRRDSLIAIMLGRLEMTVEECITEYKNLMRIVFAKKQESRIPILPNMMINPRFSSEVLAKSIKSVVERAKIGDKPVPIDEPFYLKSQDRGSRKCKV
jgi:hypothetical protein